MPMSDNRKMFFHYMFTTAFEGGVGYWSVVEKFHWWNEGGGEDIDGFYALIDSSEGDWGVEEAYVSETGEFQPITETQTLRVDLDVMKRGWDMFMERVLHAVEVEDPNVEFSNSYFRQAVVQYLTDMEDGDSDSDVADLVVQLGLFGEHVYS